MRYSKQREAVYCVLCSTHCHPDATHIYNEVRKVLPNISLGTVYRNLQELIDCGRVKKVSVEGTSERFEAVTIQHAHFVCEKCGAVSDLPLEKIDVATNVEYNRYEVTLYGLCENCKNNS